MAANVKTVGIAFDPGPAKAGIEQAKAAAKSLASSYEAALKRIDQKATEAGKAAAKIALGTEAAEKRVTGATKRMTTGVTRSGQTMGGAFEKMRSGAKKMASDFKTAAAGVDGGTKKMKKGLDAAKESALGLTARMGTTGRAVSGFSRLLGSAARMVRAMVGGLSAMASAAAKSKVGILVAVGAITTLILTATTMLPLFGKLVLAILAVKGAMVGLSIATRTIKSGLNLSGNVQQSLLSFQAMTGSLKESTRVMEELRETSKRTGGDLAASASTVKRFMALNFSPDDAIKLNKSILDVAGSIGMTKEEAKLLGAALAQVQAKGVVSMEELRQQIAEKGVPVFEELARKMNVTQGALIDMVSKGEVASKELIDIFLNLEGGFARFAGGAERMTKTLPGAINRLKANWDDLKITLTTPLAASLVPLLNEGSDILDSMQPKAAAIGETLALGLRRAVMIIREGEVLQAMKLSFQAAVEWLWNALEVGWDFVFTGAKIVFVKAMTAGINLVLDFAAGAAKGIIEVIGAVFTGEMGSSVDATNERMKKGGDLAAEYLRVSMKNALGNAMESVVNVFKDGMLEVLEVIAEKLAGLISSADPISRAGRMARGIPGVGRFFPSAPKPDFNFSAPRFNIYDDEALPKRGFGRSQEELEAIDKMAQAGRDMAKAAGILMPGGDALPLPSQALDEEASVIDAVLFGFDKVQQKNNDAQKRLIDFMAEDRFQMEAPSPPSDIPIPELPPMAAGTVGDKEGKKKKRRQPHVRKPDPMVVSQVELLRLEWGNLDKQLDNLAAGSLQRVADGMTDAFASVMDGSKSAKEAFSDMAISIIADVNRMIVRMLIQLAISKAIQGFTGAPATVPANVVGPPVDAYGNALGGAYHQGGVVGRQNTVRVELPTFHRGGLASSEELVKTEKGETILTRRRSQELEAELEAQRGGGKNKNEQGPVQVTLINAYSREEIADVVARNPDAVINAISRRLPQVRKMVSGGVKP